MSRPADGMVFAELLCALQLRDLVPPQSKDSSSQDNLDPSKRPKHVVLSDTIQLVRVLQNKASLSLQAGLLAPCCQRMLGEEYLPLRNPFDAACDAHTSVCRLQHAHFCSL